MSVISMVFGKEMVRLRSVAICSTAFYVSSKNEIKGTVGFGSDKREIMYPID